MNKILVINAGSSSIKIKLFSLIDNQIYKEIVDDRIDRIGDKIKNHRQALEKILEKNNINLNDVDLIGHRVVHGGPDYYQPLLLTKNVISNLEKINSLAPLHNPHQVGLAKTLSALRKDLPQWAVFDTGFFVDLPEVSKIYPLPFKYYQEDKIRRYGFHGISHNYLMKEGAKEIDKNPLEINIITIHLGAGSSITAIKKGKPIDTSFGFTPLEGLMMQTRAGNIDPGIIIYLMKTKKLKPDQVEDILNNQSGVKGIASWSDMRDILFLAGEKVEDENYRPEGFDDCSQQDIDQAKLALKMYIYRIQKYIGGYSAILGKVDLVVFGGEIGSGSRVIREKIAQSIQGSIEGAQILAIKTDEELQIAKEIIGEQ